MKTTLPIDTSSNVSRTEIEKLLHEIEEIQAKHKNDRYRYATYFLLPILMFFSFLDGYLTLQFLSLGLAEEANPILNYLIQITGNIGYIIFGIKLVSLLLVVPVFVVGSNKYPKFILGTTLAFIVIYVYICILSTLIIFGA